LHDSLEVAVEGRTGLCEDDDADVHIDLRMRVQQGEQVVKEGEPGVHDVDPQARVPHEHLF